MAKVSVREVASKGDSVLVEYTENGLTVRKALSQRSIVDGQVEDKILYSAAPYGVQVAELMGDWIPDDFPHRLEAACRDRGLWTKVDFEKNPALVMSALQQALHLDANYLISLVQSNGD